MRALAALAVLALCAVAKGQSVMGPLLQDTTNLDTSGGGGCLNNPGDFNSICKDAGEMASAAACLAACAARQSCSSMTWHDSAQGAWALHCVLRLDDVWAPRQCGTGCGHWAANKTSGWAPHVPAWAPTVAGFTGYIKPFWFGANTSGLDSEATLALIARHAVGGYGWQQGGGGVEGQGEELLAQAGTHLKDYLNSVGNPNNTVVFVYRQIQVALRLFAQSALAADNPANNDFWLQDAKGTVCVAGQPWGTSDPYWNFTNDASMEYWLSRVIGELATEAALTQGGGAVFFDEVDQGECGYVGGTCASEFKSGFNKTALQAAKIVMLGRMVRQLNSSNIIPILSLDNRIAASGQGTGAPTPCALPEDDVIAALAGTAWVRFYENWPQSFWVPGGDDLAAAMVANAILEGQAGVPVVLHSGAACPAPARVITRPGPLGGDVQFSVATYLIVATPGATLSLSSNWYDANFCWRPDFDVDFGVPATPAIRTSTYTWARNYTRATVELDVRGNQGNVYLLP